MARKKRANNNLPRIDIIDAGCYIDFEGFAGNEHQKFPPPILLGVFRGGNFRQIVFTEKYRWAALDPGVSHLVEYRPDRSEYLSELAKSTSLNKPLFAFSEYEKNIIEFQAKHKITKRYKNVLGISKKRFNKQPEAFPNRSSNKPNTLMEITKTLGVSVPEKLAKGGVTIRLRDVRDYSHSRKAWAKAPFGIKKKWCEVLEHNRSDCECLYEILKVLRERV
jgi:hypothetical protein